jgi:lambda repressor-like predicted transcriptional regulator
MTPNRIQYELKEHGVTQKALAQKIGVGEIHVSCVVRKLRISDRVMRAVAEAICAPVQSVFPEYYNAPAKRRTSKVSPV